jgi:hypothetical protein
MTSEEKLLIAILLAVASAIAFFFYAGLHGKYRDTIVNKLHDDCIMCDIYRFTHSNDAAFAIREAKRH